VFPSRQMRAYARAEDRIQTAGTLAVKPGHDLRYRVFDADDRAR
jgi:hypothetical protein